MRLLHVLVGLSLAACSGAGSGEEGAAGDSLPLPEGVPEGTLAVRVDDAGRLMVGGKNVAAWPPTQADLGGGGHKGMDLALAQQEADSVVFVLPEATTFRDLEPLLRSAAAAGMTTQWLPTDDPLRAVGPIEQPGPSEPASDLTVTGARPLLVVAVTQRGGAHWAEGLVAFEALARPAEGGEAVALKAFELPGAVDCTAVFGADPLLVTACEQGQDPEGPDLPELSVGSTAGCLVPLADAAGELEAWPEALSASLQEADLAGWGTPIAALDPDASLAAAWRVVAGFEAAGLGLPVLAGGDSGSGDEAPPLCNSSSPTPEELAFTGAHWLGRAGLQAEQRRAATRAREARVALAKASNEELLATPPYEAELTDLELSGGPSAPEARFVIEDSWDTLDACFRTAARIGTSGSVRLEAKLRADGRVAKVGVASNSPGLEATAACLRGRTQRLRFPEAASAGVLIYEVKITSS